MMIWGSHQDLEGACWNATWILLILGVEREESSGWEEQSIGRKADRLCEG